MLYVGPGVATVLKETVGVGAPCGHFLFFSLPTHVLLS